MVLIEEACNECLQAPVEALESVAVTLRDETHEKAVEVWSVLHGLALLGEKSGLLHNKIT